MTKKKKVRDSGACGLWVTTFDEEAAYRFHQDAWEMFSQDPFSPIVININSPGGDVYALISMMETMDSIRLASPEQFFFITHAKGQAMSCALSLFAHGDLRVASPNATLMFHEMTSFSEPERLHQRVILTKELERLAILLDNIFIEDTGFKGGLEALKIWGEKDQYLDAWMAKELGIVDVIGAICPPTITVNPVSVINLEDKDQYSFRKTRENKDKAPTKGKKGEIKKKVTKSNKKK